MIEARELVRQLRQQIHRSKTGILLVPPHALGHEADIAAQLNVQHVDFVERLLACVPSCSDCVDITIGGLVKELDAIANGGSGLDCVLVAQIDVAVTKLAHPERSRFWLRLLGEFPHRRKGLIVGVPDVEGGIELLQDQRVRQPWLDAERMARWTM